MRPPPPPHDHFAEAGGRSLLYEGLGRSALRLVGCLISWLVGWSVGWLAVWLVGWLASWLAYFFTSSTCPDRLTA